MKRLFLMTLLVGSLFGFNAFAEGHCVQCESVTVQCACDCVNCNCANCTECDCDC